MNDDFIAIQLHGGIEKLDAKCIDSLPIAMCYVPIQNWRDLYSADVGLDRGTIFSELDKPFLGRRPNEWPKEKNF